MRFVIVLFIGLLMAGPVMTITGTLPENPYTGVLAATGTDTAVEAAMSTPVDVEAEAAAGCCKVCSKGKPGGNSCISKKYTCHQPPGCACSDAGLPDVQVDSAD